MKAISPLLGTAGLVLALAACTKTAPAGDAPAATATVAATVAAPAPAAIPEPGTQLRGNVVMGKDGYGIVPCGEQAQRMLEIAPEAQPFLDKFLEGGAREFFAEAEGEQLADGHVRVLRFHRLYTEGPGCGVQMEAMAFAAWGNEPFWAMVNVRNSLRLERPGETPLVAQPIKWREEAGGWVVEGDSSAGPLSLQLMPGFCSDGMSDALYAWSATARLGGQEFKGCGFAGLAKPKA